MQAPHRTKVMFNRHAARQSVWETMYQMHTEMRYPHKELTMLTERQDFHWDRLKERKIIKSDNLPIYNKIKILERRVYTDGL